MRLRGDHMPVRGRRGLGLHRARPLARLTSGRHEASPPSGSSKRRSPSTRATYATRQTHRIPSLAVCRSHASDARSSAASRAPRFVENRSAAAGLRSARAAGEQKQSPADGRIVRCVLRRLRDPRRGDSAASDDERRDAAGAGLAGRDGDARLGACIATPSRGSTPPRAAPIVAHRDASPEIVLAKDPLNRC